MGRRELGGPGGEVLGPGRGSLLQVRVAAKPVLGQGRAPLREGLAHLTEQLQPEGDIEYEGREMLRVSIYSCDYCCVVK